MPRPHHDRITGLIADAIGELNAKRDRHRAIPIAPGTVLVGETGWLDSLGLVTLAVVLEAKVQQAFGESIVVIELILAGETDECTVASLADGIAAEVDHVPAAG